MFSHGVSLFSFVWNQLMDMFLSQGFRVLAYDFYGHGFSSIPDETYTVEFFTQQLEDLLFRLDILEKKSVILVGHSMGSVVSCEFAVKYPQMVEKVVLISSAGLTVLGSLENPFPAFVHSLIYVIRNTTWFDSILRATGFVLSLHSNFSQISYQQLCSVTSQLDESEMSDVPQQKSSLFARLKNWTFSWKDPILNRILPPTTKRFARSLNFLHKTWLFQSTISRFFLFFCFVSFEFDNNDGIILYFV